MNDKVDLKHRRARSGVIKHDKDTLEGKGLPGFTLKEAIPKFEARKGDAVITAEGVGPLKFGGVNNNAWIVLGRDRAPTVNKKHATIVDGMGATGADRVGAIDIVVGRMHPQPMHKMKEVDADVPGVDPQFQAMNLQKLDGVTIGQGDSASIHRGVIMDAARIYISATTNVDHAFGLAEGFTNPSPSPGQKISSAIGMKADEVRIIARQGIKIVTNNPKDTEGFNSQGGSRSATYGIDLIAGNGKPGGVKVEQEPLVKGHKLVEALDDLATLTDNLMGIVTTMFKVQFGFNVMVATHWHPEIVLLGHPGVPSPMLMFKGLPILIMESMSKLLTSFMAMKVNLGTWSANYLLQTSDGYINSRYNSTN